MKVSSNILAYWVFGENKQTETWINIFAEEYPNSKRNDTLYRIKFQISVSVWPITPILISYFAFTTQHSPISEWHGCSHLFTHYVDVIMGTMASQISSLTIVYSIVYSGADKKKTSKLRVTGLCTGTSPGTGEFPAQMASDAEKVSLWSRHHVFAWPHCLIDISLLAKYGRKQELNERFACLLLMKFKDYGTYFD